MNTPLPEDAELDAAAVAWARGLRARGRAKLAEAKTPEAKAYAALVARAGEAAVMKTLAVPLRAHDRDAKRQAEREAERQQRQAEIEQHRAEMRADADQRKAETKRISELHAATAAERERIAEISKDPLTAAASVWVEQAAEKRAEREHAFRVWDEKRGKLEDAFASQKKIFDHFDQQLAAETDPIKQRALVNHLTRMKTELQAQRDKLSEHRDARPYEKGRP